MKRVLVLCTALVLTTTGNAQTTWQVCVAEVISTGSCSGGTAVFTPATLTIQQGDMIQFTTRMELISGYDGTSHDIQFAGSPANNVLLPISTNILNRWTTVTTPPFNTAGSFSMECINGNHCIYAQNLNGWSCTGYGVTVVPSSACPVTAGFTSSDTVVCAGTGISFTNTSTGASSYQWYLDGTPVDTATNTTMLFANSGSYIVSLASSDSACTDSTTQLITVNANPGILSDSTTDLFCNGVCTGTASIVVSGGTPPYSYLWSSGCSLISCTNLCAGDYYVTVSDTNGCTVMDSLTIAEPPPLSVSILTVNPQCNGDCDGSISIFPSGGSTPYSYLWCSGEYTANISNLCAGTYCFTVMDANGCLLSSNITVSEPAALSAAITNSNPGSVGGCDGSASASVSGGTPSYSYSWDAAAGSQTTSTATGLCAGIYCLTVTDSNACTIFLCDTLFDPVCNIIASDSVLMASCAGACDGSITVSVSGATPPLSYLWGTGDTTSALSGLCNGIYTLSITDNNGCTVMMDSIVVDEPQPLVTTLNYTTDTGCYYSAMAITTGGTTPYSYQWDANAGGQTTSTATGLNAGCCSYSVVITDANGCQDSALAYLICDGIIGRQRPPDISVWPNPSTGDFTLDIPVKPEWVHVLTLSGREVDVVYDPVSKKLHAARLSNGIYILEVYGDGESIRKMIIKTGSK